MDKPKYLHDCEKCKFLGKLNGFDLYYCPQGGRPTLIAKDSDEAGEYKSGLCLAQYDEEIDEAKRLAVEQGFLNA